MESASAKSANPHRRRYRLSFSNSPIDSLNLKRLITNARTTAADASVQLLAIEYATQSIVFEGTKRGFNRLFMAYFHGKLNEEIVGVTAVSAIVEEQW